MSARGWPATLESELVRLRPLSRFDKRDWTRIRAQNAAWLGPWDATTPPGHAAPPRSFGAMVRQLHAGARDGRLLPFAVDFGTQFVGQLTVNNIVRGSAQFASVGYWIDKEYAGRGIIPRAVALAVDHCFFGLGLHRVEVAIRPENTASLRVVEKLGVREYGFAPRYLHIDGEWRDHRLFAVTREEAPRGLLFRLDSQQSHE